MDPRIWTAQTHNRGPAAQSGAGAPEDRTRLRALEYAEAMATAGLTRAALARRLGVSRAWVTKALRYLPLAE